MNLESAEERAEREADESALKIARLQELEDIKQILRLPSGIRFFRRMMADGKVFSTTFTGNSTSYFLEGHRNLALKYWADIVEADVASVTKIILMDDQKENTNA